MVQRILQTAFFLLLISGILCSYTHSAQWNIDSGEEQFDAAKELSRETAATLSADQSDSPFSMPGSQAFVIEWDLEEESDTKKRVVPQKGVFNNGEQLVHLINGPPVVPPAYLKSLTTPLPLFLLFEVFRL